MDLYSGYSYGKERNPYHAEPFGAKNIRGWITVAVFLSIAVHAGLFYIFKEVTMAPKFIPVRDALRLRPVRLNRVTIDPAKLEANLEEDKPAPETPVEPEKVKIVADEFDITESLPEQEIHLKPNVEMPNFAGFPAPAPTRTPVDSMIDKMKVASASTLEKEFDPMDANFLDEKLASPDQPLIPLTVKKSSKDADQLLKTPSSHQGLDPALASRYSDLDSLITGGPLLDSTKPILMPTDLLFEYNSFEVQDAAKLSLQKLGVLIQRNPRAQFIIEGHTDTTGPADYNLKLSRDRAASVANWLLRFGIRRQQIRTVGYGETRPIVDPRGTPEQQALNRRVEIIIKTGR